MYIPMGCVAIHPEYLNISKNLGWDNSQDLLQIIGSACNCPINLVTDSHHPLVL